MLSWCSRFNIYCFLDSHQYQLPHHAYEALAGAGVAKSVAPSHDFLPAISQFTQQNKDWIFCHFTYDCKNYLEPLTSSHFDGIGFPGSFLFVPRVVFILKDKTLTIGILSGEDADHIYDQVMQQPAIEVNFSPVRLIPRIPHEDYLDIILNLKQHIQRGDCYEINFCQEFFNQNITIPFEQVFERMRQLAPNPFSAYYRLNNTYLACASPERFIKKSGDLIISQPIKGTAARGNTPAKDKAAKSALRQSPKEQSENIMIVDLVRNDLSKICTEGSVHVEELMGVYSFPKVHQLISTIAGTLQNDADIAAILKATFPMGSMTGAPKLRVMQLTEAYEQTKRGIFSGTVGYISPEKDFDFNVVIRSIMYNNSSGYLSYQAGGGITINSDPELEYQECLLKAQAMEQVLGAK